MVQITLVVIFHSVAPTDVDELGKYGLGFRNKRLSCLLSFYCVHVLTILQLLVSYIWLLLRNHQDLINYLQRKADLSARYKPQTDVQC